MANPTKKDPSFLQTYLVWRPGFDEEAHRHGREIGAHSVEGAAVNQAHYCHRHHNTETVRYPMDFRVRDLVTGKEYEVAIERHFQVDFVAGDIMEVK